MKLAAPFRLAIAAVLLVSAGTATAQSESPAVPVAGIIEANAIKEKFKTKPGATVERHGMGTDGMLVSVAAYANAMSFDDVFFEFDSIRLRDKADGRQLQEILKALKSDELKSKRFLIECHTCDIGEAEYNLRLSAARTQAIKSYLVKNGVASERLATLGCGETAPAVKIAVKGTPAEIEAQRARNRRVVLRQMPALTVKKDRKK